MSTTKRSLRREMDHPDLKILWQLAATTPCPQGTSPDGAFEPIGLILQRPPKTATYAETPPNTLAFAWTGGDGVHFNFVLGGDLPAKDNPILMVVPMNFERPRAVVGRDLRDFLALGVGCGFFALERLTYDPDAFLREYPIRAGRLSERALEQLRLLGASFGIEPWQDVRARLEELKELERLLAPRRTSTPGASR
jgi:hypothetical protein